MPGLSIQYAVEQNNPTVLKCLIAIPGSVPRHELHRALMYAAGQGLTECINILLAACETSDVIVDSSEKTILLHSAELGQAAVLRTLVEAGCDVNHRARGNLTALHLSASRGHEQVIQELLKHHAKINVQDSSGNSPLHMAARNRRVSVLQALCAHPSCDLNIQDHEKKTALHICCQRAVGVECLLEAGANVNVLDSNLNTPLIAAATEGFDNIIELLTCRRECHKDQVNASGLTAVHILAMKNHWKAVECLANHGADVNILDSQQRLPLWYAVNHNRHHTIKILLKANSMTEHPQEGQGCNSLATALVKGLYGVAKLLVLAGCKLDALYPWLKTFREEKERREWEERNRVRLFVESDSESDTDDEDMEIEAAYEWFYEWVHHPHTLQQQCRISIRRLIGQHVWRQAPDLPLPQAIINYVTLKDVHDHPLTGSLI